MAQDSKQIDSVRQKIADTNERSGSDEDRKAALSTLEEAVRQFLASNNVVEAARTLNRVGRLYLDLNEPDKSIDSHNKALNLLKKNPSSESEVNNLTGLAAAYMRLTKLDLAEATVRTALSLSEKSGFKTGEAEALVTLSDWQNYSNHDLALETGKRALALWETIGDKSGIATAYFQIGQYYMALQRLSESKESNEQALKLYEELGDSHGRADVLIALGYVEHRRGDWETAIRYYEQARGLLDKQTDLIRLGQISMGYAEASNASGLPEIGLMHFQTGLDYYERANKVDFVALARWNIGRTYYLLGNYTESVKQLNLVLALEPPNSVLSAQCNEFLGRVYLALGEYDTALSHLNDALSVYARTINPKETAQALGVMGKVFEQRGEIEKAKEHYLRALEGFTRLSDRLNLAVIYHALGRLELKQNQLDSAEQYLEKSVRITEDVRRSSNSSDLATAFSATVHERYESYIECLMRKEQAEHDKGHVVRAFETSELSRGRAMIELLRAKQTNDFPGIDPQLAEKEKYARQMLRVKENARIALANSQYKPEELEKINAEISNLEIDYKAINNEIRARFPLYGQLTQPVGWSLAQIQSQVLADNQTTLVEYSLGNDKSFVWVVTSTSIKSYELPPQDLINEKVQKLYKLLSTAPNENSVGEFTIASNELGKLVLSPIASELNKPRIIVIADGALNYIPFQALPISSTEPLIARHEVINSPSASILGELQQEAVKRSSTKDLLVAFGDPVFESNYAQVKQSDGGVQVAANQEAETSHLKNALRDIELNGNKFDPSVIKPLFYAKRELAELRKVAARGEDVASDFEATREKLISADLTRFAILHFATHGFLDTKRPEHSGLLLSTVDRNGGPVNGFVALKDIYGLRAPVNLVVLSACQTALGKDVRGEGLIGLTRGFMYAGASSVVASLWKVDDEATTELMKEFYSNMLEKGMTPAAALGAAQNSIRQDPRWSSPYYWAAFTLQGDFRQVIKSQHSTISMKYQRAIAGSAMILMMVGAAWIYLRRRALKVSAS